MNSTLSPELALVIERGTPVSVEDLFDHLQKVLALALMFHRGLGGDDSDLEDTLVEQANAKLAQMLADAYVDVRALYHTLDAGAAQQEGKYAEAKPLFWRLVEKGNDA